MLSRFTQLRNSFVPLERSFGSLSLNNLSPEPSSRHSKKRVGRGIGSGLGKTCGKGHKGKKARAGRGIALGFEGGQTPLYRRLPKRGFSRPNKKEFETLGLNKIEDYVTMGRLSVEGTGEDGFITMKDLVDAKVLTSVKHGVKLVVNDKIGRERKTGPSDTYTCKYPLKLEVSRVSQQAIKAIESSGGSVVATHFNRLALRALLKPHKFEDGMLPRRARPPPKMIEYYTQYEKRGYLSKEIQLERQLKKLGLKEEESSA